MNSAHSFTEGMDVPEDDLKPKINAIYLNPKIMDLTQKKEQLLKEIETFEKIKKEAHDGIIKLRAKLRKLESVTRDAEELFEDHIKSGFTKIDGN